MRSDLDIKGVNKREVITFDSPEALERYVHIRVETEANKRVKEKLLNGWITGQDAIEQGYFRFKIRTLKAKINSGEIEGRIKGDKEVYVNIDSIKKYIEST